MLGDFFDQVSSASFDNTAFSLDKILPAQGEPGTTLGWPSNFSGTSNAGDPLSVQPLPSANQLNHGSQFLTDMACPGVSPSEDVLLAASTLLGNSQSQITGLPGNVSTEGILSQPQFPHGYSQLSSANLLSHGQHLASYATSSIYKPEGPSSQPSHPIGLHDRTDAYIHQAMFGIQAAPTSAPLVRNNHAPRTIEVRWGSDGSFLDNGYVAPPNQETEEDVTKNLLHKMEFMVTQNSASNTQPPSPGAIGSQEFRKPVAGVLKPAAEEAQKSQSHEAATEVRPRKKRRTNSNLGEQPRGVGADTSTPTRATKGKASTKKTVSKPTTAVPPSTVPSTRPRASSESQRSGRENLTEEQKRSNHILSEQKRRNLIKQGFDDLCSLVPELRGGGYSKSAILIQAADWLENLLKGNEELRATLAGLKEKDGAQS